MSKAKKGDTVTVHYAGSLNDGTVFDSSMEREPLQFTIGDGKLIPGFEDAVVGMSPGESKTIMLPPEEAYGDHREELTVEVERGQFPNDLNPQVGQHLQIPQSSGGVINVRITSMDESMVTLDANHPLAGEDLTFRIELVAVA
ncbi:MAG: peptidylprolyl isomerase [Deltaproteobacteria bacterium]|nr:peptidylprolyl isomerase [Deltaproteobacteria bacterium]